MKKTFKLLLTISMCGLLIACSNSPLASISENNKSTSLVLAENTPETSSKGITDESGAAFITEKTAEDYSIMLRILDGNRYNLMVCIEMEEALELYGN